MDTYQSTIQFRIVASDPDAGSVWPGRALIPVETWLCLGQKLGLSARELQIVQHVFDDQKLENIAVELRISSHTVSTYLQRLYLKLHVTSRPQLILLVMAEYLNLLGSLSRV